MTLIIGFLNQIPNKTVKKCKKRVSCKKNGKRHEINYFPIYISSQLYDLLHAPPLPVAVAPSLVNVLEERAEIRRESRFISIFAKRTSLGHTTIIYYSTAYCT